ncbi:ABC-F family ATP-binding cassette domain-containing protein [Demequina lignilytica]|uniref:ABC-F family ATP-binding cassette domain-containing protein n=1 Tax=Demequina lignilytica TaxID=3051663 RepID=A0AAW7M3L7_9MICO|nr:MULTISPECIES: ABC-F family ATP-binding cassette domain-containing protein [unclassified Demequina]MDN4478166.1 ABC-F family ATP-binding cassette domain-containing protein [Demequina sp. SYSU T00039-1]MDN4482755.1 ABC-F family ATP-binding cassette domain-containing protein [Demequina sp. SYSU T0a273]MDN4488384.1 ABC-F family ATP-binding cassette domain-containing protein [Demequina sp. SYSU T00039]MDN4490069.1 ABC-F family ATP-binding cassette domain-containing protein [Demequina sp. SYSU T00
MAHLLGAEALHLDFGTGTVLGSISVGLDDGDRIGIVGANGAGKSSLMKILAGRLAPHDGRVTVARGTRIGVLDQSDHVDTALTVAQAIVGDMDEHEWAADPRVRDIMSGLVPDLPADAVVGDLSGGQQRRVALAHVLVGDHDAVFLDEPTNHLDVEGVTWLAEHLKRRWAANKGALLVVTHDRWFLDEVTTRTWEVHDGEVDMYEGGYAAYVLQRVERDRIAAVTEQRRQNLMRKELAWLRRGAPARTSKPKFRIDAANALIEDVPPIRDSVRLHRMAAARLGKDVVELIRVGVAYGDHEVLHDLDWNIGPGDRIGLLGENGAGKSTLLRLVTGEQEPTTGRVKTGVTVRVAQLSQQLAELEEHADERVSAVVKQFSSITLSDGQEMTPGQLLERMGFTSAQLKTPVGRLSGGQRRRLQLLVVLLSEPNVLVLDEPTNDLDTDMLAALEDLLDAWPGTLIVVSHDRYLMERITDTQFAVVDGGLRHLPGGVDEYVELSRRRRAARSGIGTFGPDDAAARDDAPVAVSGAERREVEKELKAVERRMAKLGELTEGTHHEMVMHDQSDFAALATFMRTLKEYEEETAELEDRWLDLSERLG